MLTLRTSTISDRRSSPTFVATLLLPVAAAVGSEWCCPCCCSSIGAALDLRVASLSITDERIVEGPAPEALESGS